MEDFRHTPVIPISDKELRKHKQLIAEKNRKGYYVEIRKDTIYFYTITLLSVGILFYTFLMVNEKQMRIKQDLERNSSLRTKAAGPRSGGDLTDERNREKMLGQPKMF